MAGEGEMALPPITHVLETCLYVRDKLQSVIFYKGLLGKEPFIDTGNCCATRKPRTSAFALGDTILLLFQLGATSEDMVDDKGTIPGHGPTQEVLKLLLPQAQSASGGNGLLKQHYCFAVRDPAEVRAYEQIMRDRGVNIVAINEWERGGRSVYFTDPDGHVGEIGSRGIWPTY